jgi:hypothetical protein
MEFDAANLCFFCGDELAEDSGILFMAVFNEDGSRLGAWTCHEECVESNKHPNAGEIRTVP